MIQLIGSGSYRLNGAGDSARLITLVSYKDRRTYAWGVSNGIQLVDQEPDETYYALGAGKYRLYQVSDEPGLTNQLHLELSLGEGIWQGYLLPEGLPDRRKTKTMIPVKELITKSFTSVPGPNL